MPVDFDVKRLCGPLIAAALGSLLALGTPLAQTAQQRKICDDLSSDAYQRIAACTALIEAGPKSVAGRNLAEAYLNRAIGYELISDFARAIADHEKALTHFPKTQDNIDYMKLQEAWVRYLKEIQDDQDYANWSRPPSDAYWIAK
jgi:hypothetical protein